jgi:hypothetical protein
MITFLEAAAFGKFEEVKSTSTSIFMGKRMVLGTGAFRAKVDIEALNKADNDRRIRLGDQQKERLTDSAQRALLENFDIEDINLNPTEDMIGEHPVTETIGSNMKEERLKLKNPVPIVSPLSDIDIPASLKLILKRISKSSDKSRTTPVSPRPTSPKRQTLSKAGLPAIPEVTPLEVLSKKNKRKTPMIDLDSFLEDI